MVPLSPSRDPNVPHPGMVWLSGSWRTPEGVERRLAQQRVRQRTPEYYAQMTAYKTSVHGRTRQAMAAIRANAKRRGSR